MEQTVANTASNNIEVELSDFDMKQILTIVKNKKKVDMNGYRDNFLKRRIKLKMSEKKIYNHLEYMRLLKTNPNEIDALFHFITVNYTSFYRDEDVYDYFYENVIPDIFANKKTIRVLSAGCSTGEEPYTLAMMFKEYSERNDYGDNYSIYAIDVDRDVLNKAQIGVYNKDSLKGLNRYYIKKYFKETNNKYVISEEIKKLVKFDIYDITKELNHKHFDVIFCRNVFIYFTNEAKEQILLNFYDALNNDGYLIIGKTEMMPSSFNDKYRCLSGGKKAYQKI